MATLGGPAKPQVDNDENGSGRSQTNRNAPNGSTKGWM